MGLQAAVAGGRAAEGHGRPVAGRRVRPLDAQRVGEDRHGRLGGPVARCRPLRHARRVCGAPRRPAAAASDG
jgi:hypothetical protein